MLISYSHKFIFIHNYKTAGTSIRKALADYAVSRPLENKLIQYAMYKDMNLGFLINRIGTRTRLATVVDRMGVKKFPKHSFAHEVKRKLPHHIFNDYYKFGFVRNPWAREYSNYSMYRRHERFPSDYTFSHYIHEYLPDNFLLQCSVFSDDDGKVLLDFVGRFESLERDFTKICEHIGAEVALPILNQSTKSVTDYREMYDASMIALVERVYEKDIQAFSYSFD